LGYILGSFSRTRLVTLKFFHGKSYELMLTKMDWATFLALFFENSSGRLNSRRASADLVSSVEAAVEEVAVEVDHVLRREEDQQLLREAEPGTDVMIKKKYFRQKIGEKWSF
jgi:hypothetical protein